MSFRKLQHLSADLFMRQVESSGRILPATHIFQRDKVSPFEAVVYNPVICLILQGKKEMGCVAKVVEI